MWMEQVEEDVRRPMRQESTTTFYGKYTQDDCSASYAVWDGDAVPMTIATTRRNWK